MQRAFKRFDRDNKKFVTGWICESFEESRIWVTKHEVDMILMQFDVDGDDRITFSDFMDFIDQRVRKSRKADSLHTKIRQKIKKSAKSLAVPKNIGAVFHAMDTDGNGTLDRNEFNEAWSTLASSCVPRNSMTLLITLIMVEMGR